MTIETEILATAVPVTVYKLPTPCEAMYFDGSAESAYAIDKWMGDDAKYPDIEYTTPVLRLEIETLEGFLSAFPHSWIIRGVNGEFHPVRADIFALTYSTEEV